MKRVGWGCELARTYWAYSIDYARAEENGQAIPDLFQLIDAEEANREEAA
jgi:hypothetical protein